jgi:hypothetical protein
MTTQSGGLLARIKAEQDRCRQAETTSGDCPLGHVWTNGRAYHRGLRARTSRWSFIAKDMTGASS